MTHYSAFVVDSDISDTRCVKDLAEAAKQYRTRDSKKTDLIRSARAEYYEVIKRRARTLGVPFALNETMIQDLIIQGCYYCGEVDEKGNRIDRLTTEKEGFTVRNCISLCNNCTCNGNSYGCVFDGAG